MTERFNDGKIKIYQGDCMDLLRATPDKFYSLAIVDPPYGIGEDGKSNHSRSTAKARSTKFSKKNWDKEPPSVEYFYELFRVSKNQIVWGANHFISRLPRLDSPCWIYWDKVRTGDFADGELAWASFSSAVRAYTYRWNGFKQGPTCQVVEKRFHPTQKPTALYRWLLTKYANPCDTILDTHGGSMSIALACHDMGYSLDAIELDEEYCTAAIARLKTHQSQLAIFQP